MGGAERFTQRLAIALSQRGYEVWIAAEQWPEASNGTYHVKKIASSNAGSFSRECLDCIVRQHDGVIFSLERTVRQHIFRAGDGVHACWLKRRGQYQSAFGRWGTIWNWKHRRVLELERQVFASQRTDLVVAHSQMVKREIMEFFSFPEERIRVIPPGVDLKLMQPCVDPGRRSELRHGYGIPKDAVVWCFVGSGFERKGLLWAIQIAALQTEKVWLLVLGKGKQPYFVHAAEKAGLDARLCFVAAGTSSLDVYHASDAFILPTIYDPCANAALEAAACGLPIITTRANGAAEWIQGVILKDPSHVTECAAACAIHARPWVPSADNTNLRNRLDENICWDAMQQLIKEVESRAIN